MPMKLAMAVLAFAVAGSIAGAALASTARERIIPLPRWLPAAETRTLDVVFGGATPIHTYYVAYPRKIAVIFEFDHVVVCRTCGGPSNSSIPRGRVVRVSFSRATHQLTWTMQFCESRGTQPSRALCFHR